jgi:hypothetical protein
MQNFIIPATLRIIKMGMALSLLRNVLPRYHFGSFYKTKLTR